MNRKNNASSTPSSDEEDLPDYSQWSFERPSIKLEDEIGRVLGKKVVEEESTSTGTEDDDDLPDYSNWKTSSPLSNNVVDKKKKEQAKTKSKITFMDEEAEQKVNIRKGVNSSSSTIKQEISDNDENDEELSKQLQQSLSKINKTMNEEDEFSFIPKPKKKTSGDSSSTEKKSKKKSSNKYDFSDILFDLDSEDSSSDEEPLSYEEWKQKQEVKLRNKSPLDMLESLKKMTDSISPIDKPLNPQMTDLEHKLMLEWMFPLCKFKQK